MLKTLTAFLALLLAFAAPALASPPMPSEIAIFVCKVESAGAPSDLDKNNAEYTGAQKLKWAVRHSKMQCERVVYRLYDPAELFGAAAQPFNRQRCQASGIMIGASWNLQNAASDYRYWRSACPVATINEITKEVIAWHLPECPHRDVVVCEQGASI